MPDRIDIVLINPGDRKQVYQDMGQDYSAIEPPFWAAVIAAYLRNNKHTIAIIDANAENITPEETAARVKKLNPLLAAVIVYGSQPSASTQNMTIAGRICKAIKDNTAVKVAIGGLHPTALPKQTLEEESVDFAIEGEGPLTLEILIGVLKSGKNEFSHVPGLWFSEGGMIRNNQRAALIKNLDIGIPIAAWDLLPMNLYRAHNWHCFDDIGRRAPYAAIYTSLGCPYDCIFCCINALFGKPGIRYRSPHMVVDEIGILVQEYSVRNIKIVDELFVLDERHYMKIVDLLLERRYDLNIWAYARVDTVKPENLEKMKKAGINWIALGIESANADIRDSSSKKMRVKDVKNVVRIIQDEGIRVIGNYIFGLPDDTMETMQETLDMAMDLSCEFANFYCAMAYPGSKLYGIAKKEEWELPEEWHGFSQHSYETLPLPTKHVSAKEVLKFRDDAFHRYFSNPAYLSMLEKKFGPAVRTNVEKMSETRLGRKVLK
ncbi:MAG: radical SAM protein [Candidatus Omnitrophota bacterium]|nr:radical SAM protein [Candidatus Omnitrophota bacterium]